MMTNRRGTFVLAAACALASVAGAAGDAGRDALLQPLLEEAREVLEGAGGMPPNIVLDAAAPGSERAFQAVLASPLFLHRAVGPLDVYVAQADELSRAPAATKALEKASEGLRPLAELLERRFTGDGGLVAGERFPVVLAESKIGNGQTTYPALVALLDWAEDAYTAWKPDGNELWSPAAQDDLYRRNWDAIVLNLAHETARTEGFLEHGLGYQVLAHVVARLLRQGAWGMVPPWLAQGLTDELDIEAYGEAWVGGDWWERQTPGWFRPGWSGFVPQGASPPPPVTGPPANLAVKVVKTGDSWQHRSNSPERHWKDLVADRKSEVPASFRFMAEHESFLPRDRALARATLHVLLELAPPEGRPGLLALLDRPPVAGPDGMPDNDPITVVLDRLLGGLPGIAELESLPTGELVQRLGRPELAAAMVALGGEPALALTDHRSQSEWLYSVPIEELDFNARAALFDLFLEVEYYQQLEEWKVIGEALDRAMAAAFEVADRGYPKNDAVRRKMAEVFWTALKEPAPTTANTKARGRR